MPLSPTAHFADQAERRSQGYWLLAKLFLELPTAERLHALHAALAPLSAVPGPLQTAIAELFAAVGQALRAPETTAVAFTRGLIVVDKASGEALPFEAHVRERRLPGEATEAMQLLIAEAGYADIAPEAASPDHLGAELRLMALLCHDECQAWKENAADSAVASLRRQKVLLGDHLAQWAPDYCQELAERSGDVYVQAMARLTRAALVDDVQLLAELAREVDALLSHAQRNETAVWGSVSRLLSAVASDLPLPLDDESVRYVSHGAVLVLGPAELIVDAARKLARSARVIACSGDRLPPGSARANPLFVPCQIRAVHGHLGQFRVDADDLAGTRIDFAAFSPRSDGIFDLVLDLSPAPLLKSQLAAPGYFSPTADELDEVIEEILTLKGGFRKPRFVRYAAELCAHGAQGIKGCTRCLGVCPAQAISSTGDRIAVNAHLCQGCSTCVLVCPTGALSSTELPLAGLFEHLAGQADAYATSGRQLPGLSLREASAADPADEQLSAVLPAIAAAGMETWLGALALGFPAVAVDLPAELPEITRTQLLAELEATRLLLSAIGLEAGRLRTTEELASSFGPLPRHALRLHQNKRQFLGEALDALQAGAPGSAATAVELPDSAPLGSVDIDRSACTLCLSCSKLCPTGALQAGSRTLQLDFVESRCVQCGICVAGCPEDALRLQSRFLLSPSARQQVRLLAESPQHACPECGTVFIGRILLEKSMQLMREPALVDEARISELAFCPACRMRRLQGR